MSKITIKDLEVFYCVGVSDAERAQPQRLLITVDIAFDFSIATVSDRIERTVDYAEVSESLLKYGEGRSWKLIEKLAANIADMIVTDYKAQAATVEVKKFVIPQAQYVSVTWTKKR
jgi:dihydroneopterin aldolase